MKFKTPQRCKLLLFILLSSCAVRNEHLKYSSVEYVSSGDIYLKTDRNPEIMLSDDLITIDNRSFDVRWSYDTNKESVYYVNEDVITLDYRTMIIRVQKKYEGKPYRIYTIHD